LKANRPRNLSLRIRYLLHSFLQSEVDILILMLDESVNVIDELRDAVAKLLEFGR
jgi:hypothetical protein